MINVGHQSCNRAVITHSPLWQHFPDAMFPSRVWSTMLRSSTQVRPRPDKSSQARTANQKAEWGRLANQRPVFTGRLWSLRWCIATVSRCLGLWPNKCGAPLGSIFNTDNMQTQTWSWQSFIPTFPFSPRQVTRHVPLLVSWPNQRVGVLWRTNDQKKPTIDFLSVVFMRCNWSTAFYNRPRLIPNAMAPWPGPGRPSGSGNQQYLTNKKEAGSQEVRRFHLNWLKYL